MQLFHSHGLKYEVGYKRTSRSDNPTSKIVGLQDFLPKKDSRMILIRCALLTGKCASKAVESRIIPRYSKQVVGPTVLCGTTGMLKVLNNMSKRAIVHSAKNSGESFVRKSNKCRMFLILKIFEAIQQIALDKESNIFGLDLLPQTKRV